MFSSENNAKRGQTISVHCDFTRIAVIAVMDSAMQARLRDKSNKNVMIMHDSWDN